MSLFGASAAARWEYTLFNSTLWSSNCCSNTQVDLFWGKPHSVQPRVVLDVDRIVRSVLFFKELAKFVRVWLRTVKAGFELICHKSFQSLRLWVENKDRAFESLPLRRELPPLGHRPQQARTHSQLF